MIHASQHSQSITTGILKWLDLAYGFGYSIDWKMRLRDEAYQTQLTSEELTAQMLSILWEIRENSGYNFMLMARHFNELAKIHGVTQVAMDMLATDWQVKLTDELRHVIDWCVNYHLGQNQQKRTEGKSALVTMDLRNWHRRGRPLVRKLRAEGFTSIAVMMIETPKDSPEWREVHHVWPNDARYVATHACATRMPKFDAYLHASDDYYYNAKCLRQMEHNVIPIITSYDVLNGWRGSYYNRIGMPWSSQSIAIDMYRIATEHPSGCPLVDRNEPISVFELQPCRYEAIERRGKAAWKPSQDTISQSEMVDVILGSKQCCLSEAKRVDKYVGVAENTLISFTWEPVLITMAYDRQQGGKVLLISDRGWVWLRENPKLARTLWYGWMKPLRKKGVRLVRESDFTVNLATFTQDLPLDRPITAHFASQAIHEYWHEWKYES